MVASVGMSSGRWRANWARRKGPHAIIGETARHGVAGELVYEPNTPRRSSLSRSGWREADCSLVAAPLHDRGQRVRRADRGAPRRRMPSAAVTASSSAAESNTWRWPRTRRNSTARCRRPMKTCAKRSRPSCSRSDCARSAQMASGIAHDINNAISPVSLYTESLLEREPNLSATGRGQLQMIQRAIERCRRRRSRACASSTASASRR